MSEVIGAGSRVVLHFSLALPDGEVVDSTLERGPATLVIGDGNLLPGFEKKLLGLRPGDRSEFEVGPEEGFGQPNPANVQRVARSHFAADMALEEGLILSFANGPEGELPGIISGFEGDDVVVDFNHPLAGRTLRFGVEIIEVVPPQ